MERRYYNVIVYSVIAAVIIFFVVFRSLNTSVQRKLESQMYKKATRSMLKELTIIRKEELKEEKNIEDVHQLTPATIKVQKQSILMENQYYWDSNTTAILKETDVIQRMDGAGAFEGNKKTAEQFKRQIQRIEGRILEYEQRARNDPGDDYARQKLQGLYMLKATVQGLKNAVVEK